jgi:hypothetical protein
MTKEEIVDKHSCGVGELGDALFTRVTVFDAMDQYAEQESIAFAEWKDERYINYQMQDGKYYAKMDLLKHISQATVFTTADLYKKYKEYLKSKTQTKP